MFQNTVSKIHQNEPYHFCIHEDNYNYSLMISNDRLWTLILEKV